jgi:hypothetical protein
MFDSLRSRVLLALGIGAAFAAGEPAAAQTWRTVSSTRQLSGEKALDVRVEYGAGRLQVRPTEGDLLYRFDMRYDEEKFRPVTTYDRDAGRLVLGMDGRDHEGGRHVRGGNATVGLNPRVPVDLNLEFGAGDAQIDLGGLSLRRLRLSTGASDTHVTFGAANRIDADEVHVEAGAASLEVSGLGNTRASRFSFEGGVGETTLDFGGAWTRDATARVQMGIGSLKLRFPRGLGVRITKDSFLSTFGHEGMEKRGDAWYSASWDRAAHRVTVDIDAALGSIDVEWTA